MARASPNPRATATSPELTDPASPAAKHLAEADAAFERADWETARDRYRAALEAERSAEALDGLGESLWWLGEADEGIELRKEAFAEFNRRGDVDRAGYLASYIAAEFRIAGNSSLAQGWIGRAERLLDGAPECPAHGWLQIELCKRASEPDVAEGYAREALEIARRLGDVDIEAAARSHLGLALVSEGKVDQGLEQLDEATALAMGPECSKPMAIGETCCISLVACEQLADADRARDWGRALAEFTARKNYTPLAAWCRTVYAAFLTASGRWEEAERELERSLRDYRRVRVTEPLAALVGLADLRVRQGRIEEAARLLEGYEDRPAALVPMVRVHLARGETDLCSERIDQRLESVGTDDPHAAPAVALRVAVRLACGDAAGARDANSALLDAGRQLNREDLSAFASFHAAQVARLEEKQPEIAELEAAIESFARLGLPLEEGEGRMELARALASRRPRLAVEQARAASTIFERLGAARHVDESAALLRDLGVPGRPAPRSGGGLTKREQQVLELLGEGLSNAQIAERLVISPKTAEHHVGNVLRKLELRSRAEAAAYAVRAQAEAGPLDGGTL